MPSFSPLLSRRAGFSSALVVDPAAMLPANPAPTAGAPEAPAEPLPQVFTEDEVQAREAAAEARGRAAAMAEAQVILAEMSERVDMAETLAEALDRAAATHAREARERFGTLLLSSLSRLVGELEVFQDLSLAHAFDEVAARMVGEREVVVRVSPAQVSLAKSLIADRDGWSVRKDPEITAGVRIETERGRLDATLEAAMEGLESAVEAWRESQS